MKLATIVSRKEKAVTDGKYITARGMGASAEFAYEIITALKGRETADDIMRKIQF